MTERKTKNRPYLLTMNQPMSVKPQYDVYRDGMKAIYSIEGDITRHVFSIKKNDTEVLKLKKKMAKLLTEYTLEKDGQEIANIKKRISLLTHDLSGIINGQSLEIRISWDTCNSDILVNGRKICRIGQKSSLFSDSYEIMVFETSMEEIAVALAVIFDHAADKYERTDSDE